MKTKDILFTVFVVLLAFVSIISFLEAKRASADVTDVQTGLSAIEKTFASYQPNSLVIIPLYNGIANVVQEGGLGNWIVIPEYLKTKAVFAVLPGGVPPYRWSVEDTTLITLTQYEKGFIVEGVVQKAGKTTLHVNDSSGLTGELVIATEAMPGKLKSIEVPIPTIPPLLLPR